MLHVLHDCNQLVPHRLINCSGMIPKRERKLKSLPATYIRLIRCLVSAAARNLAELSEAILRILSYVRVVPQDGCSTMRNCTLPFYFWPGA